MKSGNPGLTRSEWACLVGAGLFSWFVVMPYLKGPTPATPAASSEIAQTVKWSSSEGGGGVREVQAGDMAHHGGTPTIRERFVQPEDNPETTNDESNDQPAGHFGTATLFVTSESSGNSYVLDADVDGDEVQRLYFPKGGWIDFDTSEIDLDGNGSGTDEQGRDWQFDGYTTASRSSEVDEQSEEDKDSEEAENTSD